MAAATVLSVVLDNFPPNNCAPKKQRGIQNLCATQKSDELHINGALTYNMESNTNNNIITACTNNNECGGMEEEISRDQKKNDEDAPCELPNDMIISDGVSADNKTCANCGKEGSDVTNTCNKCKMVMYCNAACKKKHRYKHKKDCEEHLRLAAERETELHDEGLFKQPPLPFGDCPICFLRIPSLISGSVYMSCCGKRICSGCVHAPLYDNQGNQVDNKKCSLCRTHFIVAADAASIDAENIKRIEKRVELNDPTAMYNRGCDYHKGTYGLPRNYKKALKLWQQAGDLGHAGGYANIGYAHDIGRGVEVDKKKAIHYYELAAMSGHGDARHNLGVHEESTGDMNRALKHYMIAVEGGNTGSLKMIKELYLKGSATKDDYTKALQLYQEYLGEIKSEQRERAAAAEGERYY